MAVSPSRVRELARGVISGATLLHVVGYVALFVVAACWHQDKWVRISSPPATAESEMAGAGRRTCVHGWAHVVEEDRLVCCIGRDTAEEQAQGEWGWICDAARDPVTRAMESAWGAWLLPPLVLPVLALAFGAGERQRTAALRRGLCYLGIVMFRSIVLYTWLNLLQDAVLDEASDQCWYASLRRSGRCSKFDFADHVVLFVTHYMLIARLEFSAAWVQYYTTIPPLSSQSRSSLARNWLAFMFAILVLVSVLCLNRIFATLKVFHSTGENAVALVILLLTVELPLLWVSHRTHWLSPMFATDMTKQG